MSFVLHGISISGGVAIGRAHLMSHARLEAAHYTIPKEQIAEEQQRFSAAVATARREFEELQSNVPPTAPAEFKAFINLHQMILDDAMLSQAPRQIIADERCNAEWALRTQADAMLTQFDQIDDGYLRERKADVRQVAERVMKALLGLPGHVPPPATDGKHRAILVAHDLSPADVVQFKQYSFASFLTDLGGATSHTAVVARSLNIPSIVALHHARQMIRENELLIVDGAAGVVIVDPDRQVFSEYQLRQREWDIERQKLKRLRNTPATTLDGEAVELHANIELPEDVALARESGANGIGLFRSEFLYLNRDDLPDEEEQFEAFRKVAQAMDGLPVTIRTYDLGADKQTDDASRLATNPALGMRAIRLSLMQPLRFQVQLRALLRASHFGNVRILIPMLMSAAEISQTLAMVAQAKQSLDADDIPYNPQVAVGGMIEIPAAALALGLFTRTLDFLSIGTNDLIQYTLALDRTDDTVSHLHDPLHPAVLKLIAYVIKTSNRAGIPVALCGEMAGDVELTRLLLGFGLRQFSMHPAHLLTVKQRILKSSAAQTRAIAQKMLRAEDPDKLRKLLDRLNA